MERLTSFHSQLVDSLRAALLNALPQVTGMLQALLLEVLQRRAAKLPGLMTDIMPVLPSLLASHNHALQNNALQLLKALLPGETDEVAGNTCMLICDLVCKQHPNKLLLTAVTLYSTALQTWLQICMQARQGFRVAKVHHLVWSGALHGCIV